MNTRISLLTHKKQTVPNLFLTKIGSQEHLPLKRSKPDQYVTEGESQPVALDVNAWSLTISQQITPGINDAQIEVNPT